MTAGEQMNKILEKVGLPYAFNAFPTESKAYKPPDPPFITYLIYGTENFYADNRVYAKLYNVGIELYTDNYSPETEALVEDVLLNEDITWESESEWIDSEKMQQTTYNFGIMEREESENA